MSGWYVVQGFDENAAALLIGLAVGLAGVVDPAGRVAAHLAVNNVLIVNVKVKRVVGVGGVVGVAALRFVPADDFTRVLHDQLALGQVHQGKHAAAVHARFAHLNPPHRGFGCGLEGHWVGVNSGRRWFGGGFGHVKKIC